MLGANHQPRDQNSTASRCPFTRLAGNLTDMFHSIGLAQERLSGTAQAKRALSEGAPLLTNEPKVELAARAAIVIEQFWVELQAVRAEASQDPHGFWFKRHGTTEDPTPLDPTLRQQLFRSSAERNQLPSLCYHLMFVTAEYALQRTIEKWGGDANIRPYQRLLDNHASEPEAHSPIEHLRNGLQASIAIIWNLFGSAPKAFELQYSRPPTPEELRSLYVSACDIMTTFAGHHLLAFATYIGLHRLMKVEPIIAHGDGGKGPRLDLSSDTTDKIAGFLKSSPHGLRTTGCPALFAVPYGGKKSVVHLLLQWAQEVAEVELLPRHCGLRSDTQD